MTRHRLPITMLSAAAAAALASPAVGRTHARRPLRSERGWAG